MNAMKWIGALVMAGMMSLGAVQTRPVATDGGTRFMPVSVVMETGRTGLGAYQVEVTAKGASFVGLEGGTGAFKDAPYYDPGAMRNSSEGRENKIVVAGFSLAAAAELPAGATRVATLHLAVSGVGNPEVTSKLVVAADHDGATIQGATVRLQFPQQGEIR